MRWTFYLRKMGRGTISVYSWKKKSQCFVEHQLIFSGTWQSLDGLKKKRKKCISSIKSPLYMYGNIWWCYGYVYIVSSIISPLYPMVPPSWTVYIRLYYSWWVVPCKCRPNIRSHGQEGLQSFLGTRHPLSQTLSQLRGSAVAGNSDMSLFPQQSLSGHSL